MKSVEDFVRVKEAAEMLGVSPNTIRSWGADGRIAEYRHPVNNYRLFKKADLKRLLDRLAESAARGGKRS